MFKEINQDELEEYQRLSEEEKALIIEGSSIIDEGHGIKGFPILNICIER